MNHEMTLQIQPVNKKTREKKFKYSAKQSKA